MWLYSPYTVGDEIALESIGYRIRIEQLYVGVNFDPPS
jgi:hypothetical protein